MRHALRCFHRVLPATVVALVLSGLVPGFSRAVAAPGLRIDNPYASVDWEAHGRYRANFHTHTTGSDGRMHPHEVVDRYHRLGYRILAITDHNAVTYPWTAWSQHSSGDGDTNRMAAWENRDPVALGMIAIQGNELSSHHHTGSFFNDHNGTRTEVESLDAVGAKGGLAMLYHPGRYSRTIDWYVDLYRRYSHLIGLEVYNQGDRYPKDRATWDAILTVLMPERPVWGYSNDDMHGSSALGRNYSVMLLPELSAASVRRGMEQGWSYFVYSPAIKDRITEPVIEAITVDDDRGVIHIQARGTRETVWISDGLVVHHGDTIDLGNIPNIGSYVRAELRADEGVVVGTQPFGIVRPARIVLRVLADPGAVEYVDASHVKAVVTLENISGRDLHGELMLRLNETILLRQHVAVAEGAVVTIPAAVPIAALSAEHALEAEYDLGDAYGSLRRIGARLALAIALPIELVVDAPSLHYARLRIRNLMAADDLAVDLGVSMDGLGLLQHALSLAAGATAEVRCPLPASLVGQVARLDVETRWAPAVGPRPGRFAQELDLRDIAALPRRAVPDSALDAPVAGVAVRSLRTIEAVAPADRHDRWQGPEDTSAALDWGWDGEAFWLQASVRDDVHVNSRSGADIWDGDMLQIAIAPVGGTPVDVGLALTSGGIVFHQWRGLGRTLVETADYGVIRDEATQQTFYRVRMPLADLGIPAEPGARFGLNVVIFDDDDGEGYDTWLQVAPGLAGGWNPALFPAFALQD